MVKGIRHLVVVPMFSYMHIIKEIIYIYVYIYIYIYIYIHS